MQVRGFERLQPRFRFLLRRTTPLNAAGAFGAAIGVSFGAPISTSDVQTSVPSYNDNTDGNGTLFPLQEISRKEKLGNFTRQGKGLNACSTRSRET